MFDVDHVFDIHSVFAKFVRVLDDCIIRVGRVDGKIFDLIRRRRWLLMLFFNRSRTCPARFGDRFGVKCRATLRTDRRFLLHIVIARATLWADALLSPFWFRHGSSLLPRLAYKNSPEGVVLCHEKAGLSTREKILTKA